MSFIAQAMTCLRSETHNLPLIHKEKSMPFAELLPKVMHIQGIVTILLPITFVLTIVLNIVLTVKRLSSGKSKSSDTSSDRTSQPDVEFDDRNYSI